MTEKYNFDINKRIKEIRKSRGYSQGRLAEELGMKESTYSQMERTGKIPIHLVKMIMEIFDVSFESIMGIELKEEPKPLLIAEQPKPAYVTLRDNSFDTKRFFSEELVLTATEKTNIKMLRILNKEDQKRVFALIKELHDKKLKRG